MSHRSAEHPARRGRRLRVAAAVLVAGVYVAYRIVVWWLVTAPNAGEPKPLPRDGEQIVTSSTAPPADIAFEVISSPAPRYTVVVLHGLRDSRGSMREWAQVLADGGARTVLVDARGHGRSTGDLLSYGVRESLDLVNVTDALVARGLLVGKLGVLGFSCGGATAIQWAGRDARVAAVVAVAPFATMDFTRTYAKVPLPDFVVEFVTSRAARASGFDRDQAGALAWVDKTRAPILFLHGDRDARNVPAHSARLFPLAPPGSELVMVPGATHPSMLRDADHAGAARAREWLDRRLED